MAIDREKVLQAAQKFVEKKKYDKAVLEYQKLIQEDPNDARTLLKIGDLQSKMEAYPDAISTYERVGKFYAAQGFALKAIAVYKQIRELIAKHSPQLEERYGHITPKLAELYQQLGLTSDALAALDEVATRLQRQQKDQEAIDVFRRIVDLDPTNPLPHLRLAEALSRVKDVDGAVAEFGLAASQLVRLGRRDDALKVIERLLHHKADAAHARIAAELYLARGAQNDGMQALAKLQICFQSNPKDLDTLALLARAFGAIGQAAKGLEVQKEMARIAREQGKKELFKQLVDKLVRLAPNDEGVRQLVATGDEAPSPPPPPASQRDPSVLHSPRKAPPPLQSARGLGGAARPPARQTPVDELSYDSVETDDIEEADAENAPFPLRSDASVPGHAAQDRTYDDPGARRVRQPPPPPPPPARRVRESSAPELIVGDDQVEAIESYVPEAPDTNEQLAQALADAASFRRVRLYPKAIETLRSGLQLEPRSLDLREFLRDVLIEASRVEEAVDEMLTLASLYVDSLDGDAAARALQDVLAYDPQNYRARQMLAELGYEVIDEPEPQPEELNSIPEQTAAPQPARGGPYAATHGRALDHHRDIYDRDSGDINAPLPSYDLDEVGPAEGNGYGDARGRGTRGAPQPSRRDAGGAATRMARGSFDEIDDPFGADASAPLPSFPLDQGPESEASFDLIDRRMDEEPDPFGAPYGHEDERADEEADVARADGSLSSVVATTPPSAPSPELEEALEEADFFASRGLYDDARNILNDQLARLPNHPLLRERLGELNAQEQTAKRGSGTRELPRDGAAAPSVAPASVAPAEEDDRAFDIAASLDALEAGDHPVRPAAFAAPDQQIDVEEVFAKFKEGVAKQISVDDAQSHYDLGVAYKEMGLVDDAVREFEVAARDPKRECVCRSMIGMIQMERGNVNEGIDAFIRGLNAKIRTPEQETVLAYEIGAAYESKKMTVKALEYYQKAARRDPGYRDVQDRIRRMTKSDQKSPMRQTAVGADDEFDRAFDEILGGGKIP